MPSQVSICNQALTLLGDSRIISLNDNSKAANSLTAIWDITLNNELRCYNWRFAIARALLPASLTTPAWGYNLQYPLPSDCLKVIQIGDYTTLVNNAPYISGDNSMYQIESNMILTNLVAPLKIRYIRYITNYNDFDSSFINVLAIKLAYNLSMDIVDNENMKASLGNDYKIALIQALKSNAIETPPQAVIDSSFIIDRL